ncbi:MAG: hypothetical protein VX223_17740 [Myxococcota bacterium]|nr:hypothetical protein [Myxococcota bacterium]
MSTTALQRFIVRLQLDAGLCRRLATNPNNTLRGIDLSADERGWLLDSDFRAYTSDPLFAPRVLHAIVGEYAASSGLAVGHSKQGSRVLLAFFRSERAHRAVQGGQSLSLAFCDWLISRVTMGVWSDARIAELARLEQTMARLRRPFAVRGALTTLVDTVRTRVGTSILYSEILDGLTSHGDTTTAALQGVGENRFVARLQAGMEWVLCRTTYRGPAGRQSLEVLPDALAALIETAASGSTREQVLARARALGADAGEDEAIIADLESDQVLAFFDP